MNNKVRLILTLTLIVGGGAAVLVWIGRQAEGKKARRVEYINRKFEYGKGVIVDKSDYKGHSIDVEYEVGDKRFKYSGGWDKNPSNLRKGDSIMFRYAVDSPALIITELESGY